MAEKRLNGTASKTSGNGRARTKSAGKDETPNGRLDLNAATADELRQLRGVGPALAERIVQYREEAGGFASPKELTRVPGINRAVYDDNRARLRAEPRETPAASATDVPAQDQAEQTESIESPAAELQPPAAGGAAVEAEAAVAEPTETPPAEAEPEIEAEAAAPAEAMPMTGGIATTPESVQAEAPAAQASEQPAAKVESTGGAQPETAAQTSRYPLVVDQRPREARRDWTGLMAMAVLGAVLGAVLALLAVAGLNGGTLVLNERADVVALSADLEAAVTRADALETEAEALRTRMAALEGLSNRVVDAETDLAAADAALDTLESQTSALDERTTAVEEEITIVQGAVDRFSDFLVGLRGLLDETVPADGASATPVVTATPAATEVRPTRTPAATATP